jgi:hypothetical protein
MTLEVLAADRKYDQHCDHHPRASMAAAIAPASYHAIQARQLLTVVALGALIAKQSAFGTSTRS